MSNKTINIYIPKEDRKNIDNLKVKYRLSLTTIIDILILHTTKCVELEKMKELGTKYQYKKGAKTSIKKPTFMRNFQIEINDFKFDKYATNCLMIYLKKDATKWMDNNMANSYYNEINSAMQKTQDDFWDYNLFIRKQRRMLRENPNLQYKDGQNNGTSTKD